MITNKHSFRITWPFMGWTISHIRQLSGVESLENEVLERVSKQLLPGEVGEFEIIVRRKIQEEVSL